LFMDVDDLFGAIGRLAAHPGARGAILNLGNPEETTVAACAALVAGLAGVPFEIEPRPLPADDPARRKPDIARARALLGWEPVTALRDGIAATIATRRRLPPRSPGLPPQS
jgi:nucleoside-diphosphate-sugar epimerase